MQAQVSNLTHHKGTKTLAGAGKHLWTWHQIEPRYKTSRKAALGTLSKALVRQSL